MSPKIRSIIEGVRALFSDPTKHTTQVAARDQSGREIDYMSPYATCFCFVGGLSRVVHEAGGDNFEHQLAMGELQSTILLLTGCKTDSLVGVNEMGVPIPTEDGRLVTGREGILRVCEVALQAA